MKTACHYPIYSQIHFNKKTIFFSLIKVRIWVINELHNN